MPRPAKTAAAADAAGEGQPGASAGTINGVIPSANDIKFIFAFIGNLKSKPEVNWDDLAATMGMGGKKSKSVWFVCLSHSLPSSLPLTRSFSLSGTCFGEILPSSAPNPLRQRDDSSELSFGAHWVWAAVSRLGLTRDSLSKVSTHSSLLPKWASASASAPVSTRLMIKRTFCLFLPFPHPHSSLPTTPYKNRTPEPTTNPSPLPLKQAPPSAGA